MKCPAPALTVHGGLPSLEVARSLIQWFTFVRFEGLGTLDYSVHPPELWLYCDEDGPVEASEIRYDLATLSTALGSVVVIRGTEQDA